MAIDEQVLVVPAKLLDQLGTFSGFQSNVSAISLRFSIEATKAFNTQHLRKRPDLQTTHSVCCTRVHRCKWDTPVQYTRGSGQGEARLHAKKSIGIGGTFLSKTHPETIGTALECNVN